MSSHFLPKKKVDRIESDPKTRFIRFAFSNQHYSTNKQPKISKRVMSVINLRLEKRKFAVRQNYDIAGNLWCSPSPKDNLSSRKMFKMAN